MPLEPDDRGVAAAVADLTPELEVEPRLPFAPARSERAAVEAERRGPGRPKGSRNRRTEEIRARHLARFAHPLDVLGQIYSRSVHELAMTLRCDAKDAMALQLRAAQEALPYVEQKLPVAVEVDQRQAVALQLQVSPEIEALVAVGGGAGDPLTAAIKTFENQALSAEASEKSPGAKSPGSSQGLDSEGKNSADPLMSDQSLGLDHGGLPVSAPAGASAPAAEEGER